MSFPEKVPYLRQEYNVTCCPSKVEQAALLWEQTGKALLYVPAQDSHCCGYFTIAQAIYIKKLGKFYIDMAAHTFVNVNNREDLHRIGTAIFDLQDDNLEKGKQWTSNNS